MDLWSFIKRYYIDSIVYKEGYNIVNTLTWAAILVLVAYFLYRFLEKRFEIDEKFILATVPYVFLGSFSRIVEDAGFLNPPTSYLFMSPFIFFLIFLLAFPILIVSRKIKKYYIPYAFVGILSSFAVLVLLILNLRIVNPLVLPSSISMALLVSFAFFAIFKTTRNFASFSVMFAHMFDGFASFMGISYHGYVEIHVLPGFIVEYLGPIALPLVKFAVITLVLLIVESEENKNLRNFIKLALLILGLGPALRNALRITFAV
jgi:uncharacterized membrane protein